MTVAVVVVVVVVVVVIVVVVVVVVLVVVTLCFHRELSPIKTWHSKNTAELGLVLFVAGKNNLPGGWVFLLQLDSAINIATSSVYNMVLTTSGSRL